LLLPDIGNKDRVLHHMQAGEVYTLHTSDKASL